MYFHFEMIKLDLQKHFSTSGSSFSYDIIKEAGITAPSFFYYIASAFIGEKWFEKASQIRPVQRKASRCCCDKRIFKSRCTFQVSFVSFPNGIKVKFSHIFCLSGHDVGTIWSSI